MNAKSTSVEDVGILRRISWGSIIAGVVTFLVLQLFFGVLGIAIGAASIDVLQERNPFQGLGIGTAIWFLLTNLLSFYAAGVVAGRLSGNPTKVDRSLHGFVVWGLATLASFYLITATAAGALAGTLGIFGRGISSIGQVVPALTGDGNIENIRQEVQQFLSGRGGQELADLDVQAITSQLFTSESGTLTEAQRSQVADVMVAGGMSRDQALSRISNWEQTVQNIRQNAGTESREASDKIISGITQASMWTAITMVLGAVACGLGGLSGVVRGQSVYNRGGAPYTPSTLHPSV